MDRDLRNEYMEFSSQTNERIVALEARNTRLEENANDSLKRSIDLEWRMTELERQVARLQAERAIEEVDASAKPCSFCGCEENTMMSDLGISNRYFYYLACDRCGATGPRADGEQYAIDAWNKREAQS